MVIIFRIVIAALIIWGFWTLVKFVIKRVVQRDQCPRCEGKGYWLGMRERERCNECFGTGKLQRLSKKS
ncbi:MAG: hypothetical protein NXI23_19110 [Bacteroidetes bacterium]|jgi:DnaJ-class molecular chaperone|nr:hypothetical protein [Bacteroidota bacterium]MDF1864319.1 hypothetical protein [Saprospiraceae bacterium]